MLTLCGMLCGYLLRVLSVYLHSAPVVPFKPSAILSGHPVGGHRLEMIRKISSVDADFLRRIANSGKCGDNVRRYGDFISRLRPLSNLR
jgi:hypothetical protein